MVRRREGRKLKACDFTTRPISGRNECDGLQSEAGTKAAALRTWETGLANPVLCAKIATCNCCKFLVQSGYMPQPPRHPHQEGKERALNVWLVLMLLGGLILIPGGIIFLLQVLTHADSGRYISGHNAWWGLFFGDAGLPTEAGTKANAVLSNIVVVVWGIIQCVCILLLFRRRKWGLYALVGGGGICLLCDFVLGGTSITQHALGFVLWIIFLLWFLDNAGYIKAWTKVKRSADSGDESQIKEQNTI